MSSDCFSADTKKNYELFKLQWLMNHSYTLSDLMAELETIRRNNDEEMTIPEIFGYWEHGYGLNSEIYPCFEKFLEIEYNMSFEKGE